MARWFIMNQAPNSPISWRICSEEQPKQFPGKGFLGVNKPSINSYFPGCMMWHDIYCVGTECEVLSYWCIAFWFGLYENCVCVQLCKLSSAQATQNAFFFSATSMILTHTQILDLFAFRKIQQKLNYAGWLRWLYSSAFIQHSDSRQWPLEKDRERCEQDVTGSRNERVNAWKSENQEKMKEQRKKEWKSESIKEWKETERRNERVKEGKNERIVSLGFNVMLRSEKTKEPILKMSRK